MLPQSFTADIPRITYTVPHMQANMIHMYTCTRLSYIQHYVRRYAQRYVGRYTRHYVGRYTRRYARPYARPHSFHMPSLSHITFTTIHQNL